ncbi:hypothetical protein [Lewinella sp. 4G2]|uniref:hypothetical protein n=1 Tax=Lewinella sp. 4G2 TaxID=1803372 RepID=UPI0007B4A358|nr:hypothetical protein [Lewinella sp. 4G2]OAV45352.1 hypothetical protein A3850_013000 [Lewinella sp. 4G2]
MRIFLLLLVLCCSVPAAAQFGVSAFYNVNNLDVPQNDAWPEGRYADLDNGPELQLNYWFRLPNQRIEFQPTLFFSRAGLRESNQSTTYSSIGLQMEVNVYPFDFGGDCDCPTFGKQGPALQKGFFIQGSAGFAIDVLGSSLFDNAGGGLVYGGGAGLDIGISDLITLTPTATIRRSDPYRNIALVDQNGEDAGTPNKLLTYQLGLQATFRFDHKRY